MGATVSTLQEVEEHSGQLLTQDLTGRKQQIQPTSGHSLGPPPLLLASLNITVSEEVIMDCDLWVGLVLSGGFMS